MPNEEKKIIIDEDWKTQVRREKAEAEEAASENKADEAAVDAEPKPGKGATDTGQQFSALVGSLASQALLALGVLAPQGTEEVPVSLEEARFAIDCLVALKEKTKGNLTQAEEDNLLKATSELQQVYVARVRQLEGQAARGEAGGPGKPDIM